MVAHALETEVLGAIRGEIKAFEAPAHLLTCERLLAELRLRGANRLNAEHGVD
jgi:hypothetical protein